MAKNPELRIDTSQQISRTRNLKSLLPKYVLMKMFNLNDFLKKILLAVRISKL